MFSYNNHFDKLFKFNTLRIDLKLFFASHEFRTDSTLLRYFQKFETFYWGVIVLILEIMNSINRFIFWVLGTWLVKSCPEYPNPTFYLDSSLFTNALEEVDAFILNVTTTNNVPGFITSIVLDQTLLFVKGYGSSDYFAKNAPPPNGDNLVQIASITKVFTDVLLYYYRDAQMLNLDDPVTRYAPQFKIRSPYHSNRPITLRELSSHNSGLPREVPYPCSWTQECTAAEVFELVSKEYVVMPQNERFHYSNLGIAVLGYALSRVNEMQQMTYEQVMEEIIIRGLNLSQYTGFNYSDPNVIAQSAVGVTTNPLNQSELIPVRLHSIGFENPAGGMLASANDLAKLMQFMFRNNITVNEHPNQLLDGFTVNEMLTPQMLLNDGLGAIGSPWEMAYNYFNSTSNGYIYVYVYSCKQEAPYFFGEKILVGKKRATPFF
ncbi:beta-lactamase family protein [Reticulomyxa filosa]|uniref:Beta-lactamase family protein n=1 Tax=Reticulomyxa filosa TaxID=46433 RepID=X6P9D4_RETFI|nr:beta-lactamase family protein [Reticulomyxa filosa]|eukprot:ETO34728.1 beta-lactamase family protein [Reticulomyxa filosa]